MKKMILWVPKNVHIKDRQGLLRQYINIGLQNPIFNGNVNTPIHHPDSQTLNVHLATEGALYFLH